MRATTKLMCLSISALIAFSANAGPTDESKAVSVKNVHQTALIDQTKNNDFFKAFKTVDNYEAALKGLYPPRKFVNNTLEDSEHHFLSNIPFTGWKEIPIRDQKIKECLDGVSMDCLLNLQGETPDDLLSILCLPLDSLISRVGNTSEVSMNLYKPQIMGLYATTVAQTLGKVESRTEKTINSCPAFVIHTAGNRTSSGANFIAMMAGDRLFSFIERSSIPNADANARKLIQLVQNANFKFNPSDPQKVKSARNKITDPQDLNQTLKCISDLSALGQYEEAIEDLYNVRELIRDRLPKPTVQNNVGSFPMYAATLKNPNPLQWQLDADNNAETPMLTLSRSVGNPGMIMVNVASVEIKYGSAIADMVKTHKERGISISQGAAKTIAASFNKTYKSLGTRTFLGMDVVEYVSQKAMGGQNVACKVTCGMDSDREILIIQTMNPARFTATSEEYDSILIDNFKLGVFSKAPYNQQLCNTGD